MFEHDIIANKLVFVRADLNVPVADKKIINDFRITRLLPTIDYLLKRNAVPVIASHRGRPHGYDAAYSMDIVAQWFRDRSYTVHFVTEIGNYPLVRQDGRTLLMLENLRFYAGERSGDYHFAQLLVNTIEYYVNDAWGALHRSDSSLTLVPQFFAPEKKVFGLLVGQELAALESLRDKPEQPFVVIIGGGKGQEKIVYIKNLIMQGNVSTLLLCPAVSEEAEVIMHAAQQKNIAIVLPEDYIFDADMRPITIGPRTCALFVAYIRQAKTVFYNGMVGDIARQETLEPLKKIFIAMQDAPRSIVSGGDSVAALAHFGLQNTVSYCSTGGGSTLAYIGKSPMPGLEALLQV
ncbi:MAG: phosphoglycerate kinase [Candidatus Babeliaceae bacterium]|jgi:phosphoglycerate kinase